MTPDPHLLSANFREAEGRRLRVRVRAHRLTTRHDLAHWRGEAGDAVGTVIGIEEALADRVRVLGADHPDTLATRHNLAIWRERAAGQE